jgi:alkylation response protein AidB-like acyl-CoA dehydrogenase
MDFAISPKASEILIRLKTFIAEHIAPIEEAYHHENSEKNPGGDSTHWRVLPVIEELKEKARAAGLWNLFLPDATLGAGLSILDYAPLAEEMGKSIIAPEVFNCNAPDTGNMEVLYHFGTDAQKEKWLKPLLAGEIRSIFCMTEPDVASSDATGMKATITEEGSDLVLNGKKWWITGLGHPKAKIALFMGLSNPEADPHSRHSIVFVPLDTKGIKIIRMLPTFNEYDPPYGHGEVHFENVRVPKENTVLGLGKGFAIAQGRLGPGRIHHCMRAIGAAEKSLDLLIKRGLKREAFGQPIIKLGGNFERVAELRMAIDQARLLTYHAAWKIDQVGAQKALADISAIKVIAPRVLQAVVDEAIQLYGAEGLSKDAPLTSLFALSRALRIADGPDAVHKALVAKLEMAKYLKPDDGNRRPR